LEAWRFWKEEQLSKSALSDPKLFNRKNYGKVKRGNKVFYRNYGRELKNGKGLSAIEAGSAWMFEPNGWVK
jgi:hypothetical protein